MTGSTGAVVGVDLGKTGCRVVVQPDGGPAATGQSEGAPGLAEPGGAQAAARAVLAALEPLAPGAGCRVGVGAAGATAAPAAARALADLLARALGAAGVAVTSDAVTAHAGALGGEPGAVLAAGTGAVAVGVGTDGTVSLVDGWGQWLGDEGSGSWVGRQALRAVVRARDGRGPATGLTAAAQDRFGDLAALPATLAAGGNPAAATAAFAPDVVAAAETGDAVALVVLGDAAAALAETTCAAVHACRVPTAAAVGGLTAWGTVLWRPWREAVEAAGVTVVSARGTALDGAALLAERTDLPHETHLLRRTAEEAL